MFPRRIRACLYYAVRKTNPTGSGFWQVLVQDNRIGTATKNIERIFKPFERLHGKSIYEGTGIGLAICQKIIERHHGTITVKSKMDQGTYSILNLPDCQPEENSTNL